MSFMETVSKEESIYSRAKSSFLLDEAMQMDKIGLISTNLAEKIAMAVTESPCRITVDMISSTYGQISEEEEHAVKQMKPDWVEGKREVLVLFEEMDGVWLAIQDENLMICIHKSRYQRVPSMGQKRKLPTPPALDTDPLT